MDVEINKMDFSVTLQVFTVWNTRIMQHHSFHIQRALIIFKDYVQSADISHRSAKCGCLFACYN